MSQSAGYFQYYNPTERNARYRGTDISHHQGSVNFSTMYSAGARFCIHRVGYIASGSGNLYQDNQWNTARAQAIRAAGLKLGCYLFFNPEYGYKLDVSGAETCATAFYNFIVNALGTSDMGDLIPGIDFENNAGAITTMTNDQAYNWLEAFNNKFKTLSGRNCMVYTAFYTIDGLAADHSELVHSTKGGIGQKMPLWLSATVDSPQFETYPHYNYTEFGDFDNDKWIVWQYTWNNSLGATYGVSSTAIDLDVLDGTSWYEVQPPGQVTGLVATPGNGQVQLNWSALPDTDLLNYRIYVNGSYVGSGTGTSALVVGLNNGQQYTFNVSGKDKWDEGVLSTTVYATPYEGGQQGEIPVIGAQPQLGVKPPIDKTPEFTDATAYGDFFENDGSTIVLVKNESGAAINVTFNSLRPCSQSEDHNIVVTVADSTIKTIGSFLVRRFNDGNSKVRMTYSNAEGVSICAISLKQLDINREIKKESE